jgi:hypothetical protein
MVSVASGHEKSASPVLAQWRKTEVPLEPTVDEMYLA